jgi:hypothetical protein
LTSVLTATIMFISISFFLYRMLNLIHLHSLLSVEGVH